MGFAFLWGAVPLGNCAVFGIMRKTCGYCLKWMDKPARDMGLMRLLQRFLYGNKSSFSPSLSSTSLLFALPISQVVCNVGMSNYISILSH